METQLKHKLDYLWNKGQLKLCRNFLDLNWLQSEYLKSTKSIKLEKRELR